MESGIRMTPSARAVQLVLSQRCKSTISSSKTTTYQNSAKNPRFLLSQYGFFQFVRKFHVMSPRFDDALTWWPWRSWAIWRIGARRAQEGAWRPRGWGWARGGRCSPRRSRTGWRGWRSSPAGPTRTSSGSSRRWRGQQRIGWSGPAN